MSKHSPLISSFLSIPLHGRDLFRSKALQIGLIIFATIAGFSTTLSGLGPNQSLSWAIDWTILALLYLLFLEFKAPDFSALRSHSRLVLINLGVNFVATPVLAYLIFTQIFDFSDILLLGLLIYFIAPCTDWFLGFTKLADGNTKLGALLIPINMTVQLLLFPLFVGFMEQGHLELDPGFIGQTLYDWFLAPFLLAIVTRIAAAFLFPASLQATLFKGLEPAATAAIALLVFLIFLENGAVAITQGLPLFKIALAIFGFFVLNFILVESAARWFHVRHEDHVLLSMTTTARNAPLMMAVSSIAFPNQPELSAILILGMLIEFPHLTVLSHILRRKQIAN